MEKQCERSSWAPLKFAFQVITAPGALLPLIVTSLFLFVINITATFQMLGGWGTWVFLPLSGLYILALTRIGLDVFDGVEAGIDRCWTVIKEKGIHAMLGMIVTIFIPGLLINILILLGMFALYALIAVPLQVVSEAFFLRVKVATEAGVQLPAEQVNFHIMKVLPDVPALLSPLQWVGIVLIVGILTTILIMIIIRLALFSTFLYCIFADKDVPMGEAMRIAWKEARDRNWSALIFPVPQILLSAAATGGNYLLPVIPTALWTALPFPTVLWTALPAVIQANPMALAGLNPLTYIIGLIYYLSGVYAYRCFVQPKSS